MATYRYGKQGKNTVTGGCAEAQKAARRGVFDGSGKADKERRPGVTKPQVQVEFRALGRKKIDTGASWTCNQDGTTWRTREECFINCKKAGLGGPIVVECTGSEGGSVRVTQSVKGVVSFSQETYGLVWTTPCAEGKRWNKQIHDHESHHRSDNRHIVRDWRKRKTNRSRTFTGEGADETEATEDLKRRMSEAADREADQLIEEMKKAAETFHRSPEGANAVLDCSKCDG